MALNGVEHEQLRARAVLREHRFHSDVPLVGPLIAWLRERWNSVATKWYVRPLIQQQSEFNETVADRLADLAARLQQHEQLAERQAQLAGQFAGQIAELESRLQRQHELLAETTADFQNRLHDHDAWLIAQDHEQSDLVHDLAEFRLYLAPRPQSLPDLLRDPAADRPVRAETALEERDAPQ